MGEEEKTVAQFLDQQEKEMYENLEMIKAHRELASKLGLLDKKVSEVHRVTQHVMFF